MNECTRQQNHINDCPVPQPGTGRYRFKGDVKFTGNFEVEGKVNNAHLKGKGRRPLQKHGQPQRQKSRRDAGGAKSRRSFVFAVNSGRL